MQFRYFVGRGGSPASAIQELQRERIVFGANSSICTEYGWTEGPYEYYLVGNITTEEHVSEYVFWESAGHATLEQWNQRQKEIAQELAQQSAEAGVARAKEALPQLAIFVAADSGSLIAVNDRFFHKDPPRRIAFAARGGIQPQTGEAYEVLSVSENQKHTVWFCHLGKRVEVSVETTIQFGHFGYNRTCIDLSHPDARFGALAYTAEVKIIGSVPSLAKDLRDAKPGERFRALRLEHEDFGKNAVYVIARDD